MAIEEPAYTTIISEPPFELRDYPPLTIAEVAVPAGPKARNHAFRKLAAFIFGGNRAREKIAMTAPVMIEKGEKIAMTAPVTMENEGRQLTMRFVMPRTFTLSTLPLPNDPAIKLHERPAERIAAITYSGFWNEPKAAAKESQLRNWLNSKGLSPRGPRRESLYNSPFSLRWLRRNEVWIPVEIEPKEVC